MPPAQANSRRTISSATRKANVANARPLNRARHRPLRTAKTFAELSMPKKFLEYLRAQDFVKIFPESLANCPTSLSRQRVANRTPCDVLQKPTKQKPRRRVEAFVFRMLILPKKIKRGRISAKILRRGELMLQEFARAKINLTLDITGRRVDGYHEVSMIMQTVALADVLTLKNFKAW